MSELQITARLSIHDGKLEEFKRIAKECMDTVREKDQGTLQYDWFMNPDGTVCEVREKYVDSNALMAHMGNLGATLGALMSVSDMDLHVYGTPSEELAAAAAAFQPKVYSSLQSL